jgi:transcriptional regulator with GAF, ATPase, and Fis domain
MQQVYRMVQMVAPRRTTVLITGPTGSGKEVIARAVHQLSPRATRAFVVVNCAAIPETLLESELFGYRRGAFTGADENRQGRTQAAHGGTLFLDEIGEMPLALQSKVLRFLQSSEVQKLGGNQVERVDVRVIAATNADLQRKVAAGEFREDLYFRLAVFPIALPPLASRLEDVIPMAEKFLASHESGKRLAESAKRALLSYSWPGNVRQLEHVIERAEIISGSDPEVRAEHILLPRVG